MTRQSPSKPIILSGLLVLAIIISSAFAVSLWGVKHGETSRPATITINQLMTVAQFATTNDIPRSVLKEILALNSKQDLAKQLASFAIPEQELLRKVKKAMAIHGEESSKNWMKIPLKFGLWFTILLVAFFLLRTGSMTATVRKRLYFATVLIFGVILGADPSPMGPVKDTITLFGANGVFYKPRIIALTIFLATALFANKFICAWGCQFGVLQDLLFRFNRNQRDTRGILRQYKPPFWLTNIVRIIFCAIFIFAALNWATDIIEPIDPFKLYKPLLISTAGWIFLGIMLMGSLFIYRPWCHLFCPFGLAGWLVEQVSIFKIRIRRDLCTDCGACTRACPSHAMATIFDGNKVKADCFACGTCIEICPTKAIKFS